MADAFTTAYRLCKPEVNANDGTWGGLLNSQTFDMLDEAIGGYIAISVASGDVTLTTNNGTTDQARNKVIKFTGSPGADRTVTAPNVESWYMLWNAVGDSSNILFKAVGGSSVTIPAGGKAIAFTDSATGTTIIFLTGTVVSSTLAQGSAVSLSSGVAANITSITLQNGVRYRVNGAVTFTGDTSTTVTNLSAAGSATSATFPTIGTEARTDRGQASAVGFATNDVTVSFGPYIVTGAGAAHYLVGGATFAVSTCSGYGFIRAEPIS